MLTVEGPVTGGATATGGEAKAGLQGYFQPSEPPNIWIKTGGPGRLYKPRRQSHQYQRRHSLHLNMVSVTLGPHSSFPACRDYQRSGLGRTPGWVWGRDEKTFSNLTSKQQVQRNKTLYNGCSWPDRDSGPPPTQDWPNKSWAKQGPGHPQRQCMELRKMSLQDSGENGRTRSLLLSNTSSTSPTCPGH